MIFLVVSLIAVSAAGFAYLERYKMSVRERARRKQSQVNAEALKLAADSLESTVALLREMEQSHPAIDDAIEAASLNTHRAIREIRWQADCLEREARTLRL